jgi:hypothetical protein
MAQRMSAFHGTCKTLAVVFLVVTGSSFGMTPVGADQKKPYQVTGVFVEGCSCNAPCACQLTGLEHGCQSVGAIVINSGRYQGVDISGTKFAFASSPTNWVRLYIDAKSAQQRKTAEAFARAAYTSLGKIEAVRSSKIQLTGKAGNYKLLVDSGKTISLTTKPILGGDGRTPLVYSNLHDPLHSTVMQAKTVSGSYKDGEREFTLVDSNSYFHPHLRSKGRI